MKNLLHYVILDYTLIFIHKKQESSIQWDVREQVKDIAKKQT